jgi:hypothetical protein
MRAFESGQEFFSSEKGKERIVGAFSARLMRVT